MCRWKMAPLLSGLLRSVLFGYEQTNAGIARTQLTFAKASRGKCAEVLATALTIAFRSNQFLANSLASTTPSPVELVSLLPLDACVSSWTKPNRNRHCVD